MWVLAKTRTEARAPVMSRSARPRIWPRAVGCVVAAVLCLLVFFVTDYNWPTRTGNLCVFLFVAANTYVPVRQIRKRFHLRGVQHYLTWLLRWHCYLNSAAFVAACAHCYTTSWTNNWLWASLVVMGVLTMGGFLLKLRYPPKVRKGLYVLHTQQLGFLFLLYALIKGHYVFLWLP